MKTLLVLTSLLLLGITEVDSSAFIENHYAHRAFVAPIQYTKKDIRCLTEAIYYEAGNQSQLGKEAVAAVVVNRVRSGRYPKTVCGVVYQYVIKNEIKVCQFSFTCFKRNTPDYELWKQSKIIAYRVLQNYYFHDTLRQLNSALFFHAEYVHPEWARKKQYVGKIGQHLFYRDKGVRL